MGMKSRMRSQHRYTAEMHPDPASKNGPVIQPAHESLPRYGTHLQRLYVLKRDGYRCRYCGCEVTMELANLDHIDPWKHGGRTEVANLVTACQSCNKAKGNQIGVIPKPVCKDRLSG